MILGLAEQKASALLSWSFLIDSLEYQIKVGPLLAKWEEERYPIDIQPPKLTGVDVGASSSSQFFIKKDDHAFIVRTIDRERHDSLTIKISHLNVDRMESLQPCAELTPQSLYKFDLLFLQ